MTPKKLYFVLVSCITLLAFGLVGAAYGANKVLQNESEKLLEVRSTSMALEQQQTQLSRAKKSVDKYKDIAETAKSVVPQDKDQAQTVREIVTIADRNNIRLSSVTFPSSTLGATTGPATAPAAGKKDTSLSQLLPVPTIAGVYSMNIIVQSDTTTPTSFTSFISFLNGLERNRRTALVSGITLTPSATSPGKLSFTLTLEEYVKP